MLLNCLLHHFIFYTLVQVLLIGSVLPARLKTLALLKYTNQNHPSPMQRVVVYSYTGEVYVSARNALYHFTSDLKLKGIVSTGPQLDNSQCLHPDFPCKQNRTLTDNDNKVLEIFQTPNISALLTCGTVYQGLCQLHQLDDISRSSWLKPYNDTVAFISGNRSTVAVLAEGYDNQWTLYSAASYEGRPWPYPSASVSSKVIVQEEDFELKYSYKTDSEYSGIDFSVSPRHKSKYIMGFSHGDFVYFLTTQKGPAESSMETRLARVCKHDPAFYSYTEIPLHCKFYQEVYNFATAAHLGSEIDDTQNGLVDVLFVSFMKHVSFKGGVVDETRGSVICPFPMQAVTEAFTNATRDCFKGEAHRKRPDFYDMDLPCTKMDDAEIDDNFCGSPLNSYIASDVPLEGDYPTHVRAGITSLATMLQRNRSIAVAGTDTGDVIKVDLDWKIMLFAKNIAADQEDKRIRSSNAFDSPYENIYLLVGNEVVMFNIGSCSVYTDCVSCVGTLDPLGCTWCGDHCVNFEECETDYKSCSPVIYEVKPLRGLARGGTLITVTGNNFYIGSINMISVKVADVPCVIVSRKKQEVKCKTKYVQDHTLEGFVEITVFESRGGFRSIVINGTARSQENFTYITPLLYGIHPGKGPISGGTNITLFGSNLDIGHNRSIKVAGSTCKEIGIRNTAAWCVTGEAYREALADIGVSSRSAAVEFLIDDAVIEVENQIYARLDFGVPLSKDFKYLPDPEIYAIQPNVTTVSGTKNLIVSGKHLDSVERSRMIVNVATITGGVLQFFSDPCWFSGSFDGNTMICPTPKLESSALRPPTERAPLVTHVGFMMDGVQKVRQFSTTFRELSLLLYYPDPKFEAFPENGFVKRVSPDHIHLEVKGKYLNLAHTPSDIKVLFDNATACSVISLSADSLICELPDILTNNNLTNHSVTVSVGSLTFLLGQVEFIQESIWYKNFGIFVAIAVVAVVAGVVCLFYVYKLCKKRMAMKQLDYRINFAVDENDTSCPGVRRQGSTRNDYQDLKKTRINHENSAATCAQTVEICQGAATADPLAVDDTMHILQSQNMLVPRNILSLGQIIGGGHFGCVYKGEMILPGKQDKLEVAVKTLHKSWSILEPGTESFLQEGLMMKDFHHQNVLTLIGVCFERNDSPMIIIPFMKHGDLRSYIRNENNNPTIKDLLMFGVQIASGMKYLTEMKFVHRDLAARNCMLNEDKIVKVADFGLSRDLYERDYYASDNKKTKLPIRWMPPESIEKGSYTSKSDVWSYGVVLWELMTRGIVPYPEVDNWDILHYLKAGRRLPRPSCCPGLVYDIMLGCWNQDPKLRPTFAQLEEQVQSIIATLQRKSKQRTVGLNVMYVNYSQIVINEDGTEEA